MRRAGGLVVRVLSRLFQLALVLVTLLLVVVMVFGAITTQRGWPQTTGTVSLSFLNDSVQVVRDRYGILQITADDPHDLFMAQGYAHAQERMWQMEISRRIGAGRLSELFGSSTLDTDRYVRTLGWRVAAQRDLDAMSPDSLAILDAYSKGVNAWIDEHNGRLSTPFVFAGLKAGIGGVGGFTLEQWTPLDTATWQKVQAWSLGGNVDTEIFRLLADARLGSQAKTDELFPAYDSTAPVVTPTGLKGSGGAGAPGGIATTRAPGGGATAAVALTPGSEAVLADIARMSSSVTALAGLDRGDGLVGSHGVGSNNWVVSGDRTQSGKPILANDPHLGFSMPSVWIINGLHCREVSDECPWDVSGVTFPGAPGIVLGHNAHIAWGATNVRPDTQDLFLESVDKTDPSRYIFKGQSVPFDVRHETIKVAGGADVALDVRSTGHGVVLSDVDSRLKDGPVLSLRWTATAETDLTLQSFFRIDVASDFDAFHAAFDDYGSPSQNFIYADVDGHIGYVLPGLIPLRDPATPAAACPASATCIPTYDLGDRIRDGASGSEEWVGYVPRDALPWQLDPAGGRVVSANNAAVDDKYPYFIGDDWDPGYRAARVSQLLSQIKGKITIDDMRTIEMDTEVLRTTSMIPALMSLNPNPATADGKVLLQRIGEWDGTCAVDSYGCAAYMAVELALQRAIFDDDLGPIARDYVGTPFAWTALLQALLTPSSRWWDLNVQGANATHDPTGLVSSAIDGAAADLKKTQGDPAKWQWGTFHKVTFREGTLGRSGILPLELYFNPSGRAVAGADGTIDNNYYRISRAYADPRDPDYKPLGLGEVFDVTNGPSLRFMVDMNDLDAAQIVITTGQSGNPFAAHYGDMIPLWAAGQTVELPFSAGNVAASAVETLTLTPK
jgi:penicillin G amidase